MKNLLIIIFVGMVMTCMAAHEIVNPRATTWVVVGNPIRDIFLVMSVETNQTLTSGQPILLTGTSLTNVCDKIFSYWATDEDGQVTNRIPREIVWSKGYTKSDVDATIAIVQMLIPDLKLIAIKHPSRDEYALPWCQYLIDMAPAGALKTAIVAKHNESIAEGNVKTHAEMLSNGW